MCKRYVKHEVADTICMAGKAGYISRIASEKTNGVSAHPRIPDSACQNRSQVTARDARMSQGSFFFMRDVQIRNPPPDVFVDISNVDVFVTFVHSQGVKIGTYYIY